MTDTDAVVDSGDRLIRLTRVGHWFVESQVLFEDVYATFSPGSITGVCGPSGCGKSTLLALVAGWDQPQRGVISRVGVSSVAWVFQNPHGVAKRTALDHVAFPLLVKGFSRGEASAQALETMRRFGVADVAERAFSTISGGEAQRLMLARALAVGPDVLLVDEPTAQLDRQSAAAVNETLGQVASAGAIVVIATHDRATQEVCDGIIDLGESVDASGRSA